MDGIHDLGGRQGFGPIQGYPEQKVYKHDWELLTNALSAKLVALKIFNMDEYRHAIERMVPVHYMTASYYERVLVATATLCVEKGLVSKEQLETLAGGSFPLARPNGLGRLPRHAQMPFAPGQQVRVRNEFVAGHHRMPGYLRGHAGVVVHESPPYPYPDAEAHGCHADWEPTYEIGFQSRDIWPNAAEEATITVALFRSYLEPVGK